MPTLIDRTGVRADDWTLFDGDASALPADAKVLLPLDAWREYRDAWLARLEQAGVPAAPVLALDETLADPQFAALDILQPVPGSDSRLVGLPLHFDGARPPLRSGHPAVGDRTDVLAAYFPQEARDERIA